MSIPPDEQRGAPLESSESNEQGFVKEKKRRRTLWENQEGKCYYCDRLTILPEDLLAEFVSVIENPGGTITVLLRENRDFKSRWHNELATIEHLIPRGMGGSDRKENVVMACAYCNQKRGLQTHQEHLDNLAMFDKTSRRMPRRGYRWDHFEERWVKREKR